MNFDNILSEEDKKPVKFTETQIAGALALAEAYAGSKFNVKNVQLVGSAYIKGEGHDIDVLVHVEYRTLYEASIHCEGFSGWTYGGSSNKDNPDSWESFKKLVKIDGAFVEINMILVDSEEYYNAWVTSAEVCKFLYDKGVELTKGAIHGVHAIIMDDSDSEEELKQRNY